MRRILAVLLIVLLVLYIFSCEKDDICVEGDTPLLTIGFYDIADSTAFKTVPSLRIRAINNDKVLNDKNIYGFSDRSNSPDSIFVPLKIEGNSTTYEFIMDSSSDDTTKEEIGNRDTLTFDYTVNRKFVSRACGFVANFNGLDTTRQVFGSDWIKRITILTTNVEQTKTIDVKIFH